MDLEQGGSAAPLMAMRGIVKRFGALTANDHVNLAVPSGEIHALLGENGAGKSTLVKILYGAIQADAGDIFWKGQAVRIPRPAAARALGIGMVFQHFSLFEALTVAENIALGMQGGFDMAALSDRVTALSRDYGLPLDPRRIVADLSVGERQRIEIVRALLQNPSLLVMDEPTAVLTPQEADQLFVTLRRLASEGRSILYISHRLEEVRQLCSAATILRHGKVVATLDPGQETAGSLARAMVGSQIHELAAKSGRVLGPERLVLRGLSLPAEDNFAVALKAVDLAVHGGELVCIAGVAGNGQSEIFDAISGERASPRPDMVVLDGVASGRRGTTERRRAGAAFVPEERLGHGAVPGLPLSDNVLLTRHASDGDLTRGGFLRNFRLLDIVDRVTNVFDVRKGRRDAEARSLSGGNLQKFAIGREMDRQPGILVVNQPTWGVDAGAAAVIRQALIDLAAAGSAVLVISQDLDEIYEIADRIAVISRGQLSLAYPAAEIDREQIGLLMAGAHEAETDEHAA